MTGKRTLLVLSEKDKPNIRELKNAISMAKSYIGKLQHGIPQFIPKEIHYQKFEKTDTKIDWAEYKGRYKFSADVDIVENSSKEKESI